ncbi:MAG: TIGR00159 family protein [Spirochaetes bacterium GWF1_51_8]|nr:MAG: TIGR00159 family protein [Spirochaetes bacterium GWF1_51_8]
MEYLLNIPIVQFFVNIIDILAVAYFIYFLYTLFEDTNSITILKGFIVIIAISIAANLLGLTTLAWLFKYVITYGVILIVVLFQPEIRRLLSRVGRSGIGAIRGEITEEALSELTRAVLLLAEDRTGALIIFERNVGLKDLIENSIKLDSSIQAELLLSIFYKSNILHDGAVIVEGDKIIAARVIIPGVIVETFKTKKRLGTRHRAGVAITVDTDAISIIVSEETGKISLAHNGKLEYDIPPEKFSRRMNDILALD